MIKKTLYVSGSLLGIYILFEFFIEIHTKKQLKKQIKRLMNKTGSNIGDCNYKIILERSVSFTKFPKLSCTNFLSTVIVSPALSVALKLISSKTFSMIV